MSSYGAAFGASPRFIPGITGMIAMNALYAKSCSFTISREPSTEPNVWVLTVSDFKGEVHKVRLSICKPRMETAEDLSCRCTCDDYQVLERDWGVYCDHIMLAMGEVTDTESEMNSEAARYWKRVKVSGELPSGNAAEQRRVQQALRSAPPEQIVARLLSMTEEDADKLEMLGLLFPSSSSSSSSS